MHADFYDPVHAVHCVINSSQLPQAAARAFARLRRRYATAQALGSYPPPAIGACLRERPPAGSAPGSRDAPPRRSSLGRGRIW